MIDNKKTLNLKVAEAVQDDVNKGIVRIDRNFMKKIEADPGDIVELEGKKKTVAIVDRAYPGDIGLEIIRMDGLIRRNTGSSIGERVRVRKTEVKEAKKVVIAPTREGVMIKASSTFLKQGLLGRAVSQGDIVSWGGTKSRRTTTSQNPFFEDVFSMLDNTLFDFGLGDIKFIVAKTMPNEPVIITETTEVEFISEPIKEIEKGAIPEVTYEDIGGLDEEIKKIREMVELPLKHPELFERLGIEPPKGVLLHGPPGTGKTLLAKAVANESDAHFILINGPEIMSKYYGQSEENLRKKFEEAQKNAPSIIFIDEIDAIAGKREETKGEVERRVVAQLLTMMDGLESRGKVVVIGATNIPNSLDPALRRPGRFDREISIRVPRENDRENILKIHTRNMPLDKDINLKKISRITHGFVGADLSALAKESAMIVLRRIFPDIELSKEEALSEETLKKLKVTMKDFMDALKSITPSAMREVTIESPNVHWDEVGGLKEVKEELEETLEWPLKRRKAFERLNVKPPKGVLLYGAPGTGKTLLAKAVATETEANFILIKGPELLSKWVGESERAVRKIFEKARQSSPCIICFDEIDAIAPRRGVSADSHATERVINQLLTEMDGLQPLNEVMIVATTNRPDIIDPAFLRPGRFDRIIHTGVPDKKARKAIFEVHTKNMPLAKDVDLDKLAEKTENYVGADIEAICREAAIFALREDIKTKNIKLKHFQEAMKKVRPSVTKEIEESYKRIKDHFTQAKAKEMKEKMPNYFG
ncbi:CDC48 family AAA ATPase [Candidatus Woesearchaeota archaeon]|nr:CDC48 family AAA ATPase [Candidatus Woesearchaeota archaeon]